jgi:hypothetical protein
MDKPKLDTTPVDKRETKRERRTRLAFTWLARIFTFGMAFKKK